MKRILAIHFFSLVFFCFGAFAQPTFKFSQRFFEGEKINHVSVGSTGVWAVTGLDSLGLVKVDTKGIPTDYSNITRTAIPKAIRFLAGNYRNDALLGTEDELYWFRNGVIEKVNKSAVGISGSKILGVEFLDNRFRIATEKGLFTSFDNLNGCSVRTTYSNLNSGRLLGGTYLFISDSPRCGIQKSKYNSYVELSDGIYQAELLYDLDVKINDFAYGRCYGCNGGPTLYIAQNSGLSALNFGCTGPYSKVLKDTIVYCITKAVDTMLVGTEKGLFHLNSEYVSPMPLNRTSISELIDVPIYCMTFENEKGLFWVGTNNGLLSFNHHPKEFVGIANNTESNIQIGGKSTDQVNDILVDKKGNKLVTGYFKGECKFADTSLVAYNAEDYFLASYNKTGKLNWIKIALAKASNGQQLNEQGVCVTNDSQGNIYTGGYLAYFTSEANTNVTVDFGQSATAIDAWSSFITKYDANGKVIWTAYMNHTDANEKLEIKVDQNGSVYVLASFFSVNNLNLHEGKALLKFDANGVLLWTKSIPSASHIELSKSGIIVAGRVGQVYSLQIDSYLLKFNREYGFYILSFDQNGNIIWGNSIERTGSIQNDHVSYIHGLQVDGSGNIYLNGFAYGGLSGDAISSPNPNTYINPMFYAKLNPNGKFLWLNKHGNGKDEFSGLDTYQGSLAVDSLGFATSVGYFNGTVTFGPYSITTPINTTGTYILRLNPKGNIISLSNPSSITQSLLGNNFRPSTYVDSKGNIMGVFNTTASVSINGKEYLNNGDVDAFLVKLTDSSLTPVFNTVRGRIYADRNQNKHFDLGDEPMTGLVLKAEPGEVYSQTDLNGEYVFYLAKGNYSLSQIIPDRKGLLISQSSPKNNGYQMVSLLRNDKDTSGFDFIDNAVFSSFVNVDISAARLRRCFRGSTYVKYCNEGFADAKDVQLKVEYPKYVIPISSDLPWKEKKGQIITFNIGTIPKGICHTITITDSVQCGDQSILGLTQCTKAFITPSNTIKPVNPNWDQSNVEVIGNCKNNGSVRAVVVNNGLGDMGDSSKLTILLDTSIVLQKQFRLATSDSISLDIPANGASFRMETAQTANNPNSNIVVVNLEGCKTPNVANVSKGVINQLPNYDEAEELEVSCMSILGSFDPNDKQVFPSGVTENHNVAEDIELEYILRFQNTGSDTAFTVLVTDTLSELLDISTFKPGITSHSATWNVTGEGKPVVSCKFNKINLPDSTTNELASHGFLKFSIYPIKNIKGQQIRNKGYIYFDFNDPVITNEVVNTMGLPEFRMETIAIQYCNNTKALPDDSLNLKLCGEAQISLPISKNDTTYSTWRVVNGEGDILEEMNTNTKISNLRIGTNQFELKQQYCDVTWFNRISIQRDTFPAILKDTLISYCEGALAKPIIINSKNLEWYDSPELTSPIAKGTTFLPEYGKDIVYYVKQNNNDCSGKASFVKINFIETPTSPTTQSGEYCYFEKSKRVVAEGQNIKWYYDTLNFKLAGYGKEFVNYDLRQGESQIVFATQSKDGCESKATNATITVKPFSPKSVFLPNVISRSKNEGFYLPQQVTNECVGDYENISVFDSYGHLVFHSEDESFNWHPVSINPQILFYQIRFKDQIYKGRLIIID